MSDVLFRGVIPSISEREGIDVTATVMRTSAGVEIAYSFDDPEQHDIEDPILDAETCACIADRLKLVEKALHAANDLLAVKGRIAARLSVQPHDYVDADDDGSYRRANEAYCAAQAALPLVITT